MASATNTNATKVQIVEAGRIAKDIQHIHPNVTYDRALGYGKAILTASRRFGIDSSLLVSIAHQESGFRENLKEGRAGELGICQIRKMWVKNEKFQNEFGMVREKELLVPAKSFLYAAWILKDLKDSREDGAIPYWSYYNAVKFHNRLKYYTLVNRYLSAIKSRKPVKPLRKVAFWVPEKVKAETVRSTPVSRTVAQVSAPPANNSWIPAALKKLQSQSQRSGQAYNPAIVKAAYDLNLPNLFGSLPVRD